MIFWFFVGIVAAVLTMFGFIPQIIRMYRTRSVKDISVLTLVQLLLELRYGRFTASLSMI